MPCIFSQLDLFSEVSVEQYTSLTCDSGLGKASGGRGEGCQLGLERRVGSAGRGVGLVTGALQPVGWAGVPGGGGWGQVGVVGAAGRRSSLTGLGIWPLKRWACSEVQPWNVGVPFVLSLPAR